MTQSKSIQTCDVAVIGAGIIGASIGYHLAERGAKVTVIDSNSPGSGASSHSFAWINAGFKSPYSYHEFSRKSMNMWDHLARKLDMEIGLRWGGKISWESTDYGAERLKHKITQAKRWGYPSRLITKPELQELAPELSFGNVTAAEFTPVDGQVEPQLVINACLKRAKEYAATLITNTEVVAYNDRQDGDKVTTLTTASNTFSFDYLVIAAGVDTTSLAAKAGVYIPQEVSPGVVIRTDSQPPLLSSIPIIYAPGLDIDHPEIHIRQCHDGTLMIGEGDQESIKEDDTQDHADDLLNRAIRYLPSLKSARAIPVPVGFRPMPLDGYPILGFASNAPNVYIALTHSGVTLAPLIGELATIEILDDVQIESVAPYRPERFL